MSVRKSVAWTFSGQFLSVFVAFAGSVVVARLLSPHEMGIYAVAGATIAIVQIFASFGVGAYVVREIELPDEKLDSAFTINALLAIFLAVSIFVVSFASGWLLGDENAGRVLRLLALSPLFGIFSFHPATLLQREMQFKTIALITTGGTILLTGVTVLCALNGVSYMSPAWGAVVATLATTIAYNFAARHHIRFRWSFATWRDITRFGLRIMWISGLPVFSARLCDVILGRVLGLAALGLYSRASNLSNMIFDNVYGTATRVIFSKLAQDLRERGEMRHTFLHGLQLITAVMWPLLAGLGVLAGPAIRILYGEQWLPAAPALSLLMLGQILALGFSMNWELFVLRDEVAKQTRIEAARAIFAIASFAIGCQFGLAGAATGRVADALVGLILYYPHMHRLAGTHPGEMRRAYGQSFVLMVAAAAPSLALMLATDWSAQTPFWLLVLAIGTGVVLWFMSLLVLKHPLLHEMRVVARRIPGLNRFGFAAPGS